MKLPATLFLAVACSLLWGCGASNLSSLRGEYEQAIDQRRACLDEANAGWGCIADDGPRFRQIAQDAAEGAKAADDIRMRVSFYVLAAEAMGKTGPDGRGATTALSDQGLESCAQAAGNIRPGARDCALLYLLPVFAENDALVPTMDDLKSQTGVGATRRPDFEQIFDSVTMEFRINVWSELKRRAPKALAVDGLHYSVKEAISRESRNIYCNYYRFGANVAPSITLDIWTMPRERCGSTFEAARESMPDLTESTFQLRCDAFTMLDELNDIARSATGDVEAFGDDGGALCAGG